MFSVTNRTGEAMSEGPNKGRPRPKGEQQRADPTVTSAIGTKLRALYNEVLTEPVPDKLADLVRRLAPETPGGKDGGEPK